MAYVAVGKSALHGIADNAVGVGVAAHALANDVGEGIDNGVVVDLADSMVDDVGVDVHLPECLGYAKWPPVVEHEVIVDVGLGIARMVDIVVVDETVDYSVGFGRRYLPTHEKLTHMRLTLFAARA